MANVWILVSLVALHVIGRSAYLIGAEVIDPGGVGRGSVLLSGELYVSVLTV